MLPFFSALHGGGGGNEVDDTSGEDEASVKQHKAKPYLFPGRSGADAMEHQHNGVRASPKIDIAEVDGADRLSRLPQYR